MKIGFIGLGNMAKAIIGGMLKQSMVTPEEIVGSAKTEATMEKLRKEFGIRTMESNRLAVAEADVLILAVKPVFFSEVIEEIKEEITENKLIISIAAGKTMEWIETEFGKRVKLIRCMPNTPALVGEGCTAMCGNSLVKKEDEDFCLKLMGSFGKAIMIPERLMDAAGAVSGSSPAYVFMFIEAMADGAVAAGMPRKQAYEFAAQAVLGSAKMVLETGIHPGELKDMVCSPGGTTIEGVRVLEEKGMRSAVMEALCACVEKSKKL
ncbi:MAG: pyrroline-5-carboxylate reductase [Clostridiales bacterium]|nr:pyrroline-5-carboxylate reductase [Clostridiales bacterium]